MNSVENLMLFVLNRSDVVSVIILMLEFRVGHRVVVMRMMMADVLVRIMVLIWCLIRRVLIVFLTVVIHVVRVLFRTVDSMEDLMLSVFNRSHVMSIVVLVLKLGMGHTISVVGVMMTVMLVRIVMLVWCLIRRVDLVLLTIVINVMRVLFRPMDSVKNVMLLDLNWCDVVGIVILVLKLWMGHMVVAMVLLRVMNRLSW